MDTLDKNGGRPTGGAGSDTPPLRNDGKFLQGWIGVYEYAIMVPMKGKTEERL